MKRYALWALIILAAWWVIQDPASAAHLVRRHRRIPDPCGAVTDGVR